jgi:proteasome lid subunit RPN8/RPN11
MLKINRKDYAEIRRHGEETYPHECCGVLLGQMDGDARIQRQGRERGEDIIGFYHSHPDHPAQWSQTDLEEAHWIGCSYVITRVAAGKADVTNSFELTGADEADKAFRDENVEVG